MKGIVFAFLFIVSVLPDSAQNSPDRSADSLLQKINQAGSDSVRSVLYLKLSDHFFRINPDTACFFASQALKSAEKDKIDKLKTRSLRSLGILLNEKGDHFGAREKFQKALVIYKKNKDTTGIASSYGNIGNTFLLLGDEMNAFTYYQKALEFFTLLDNKKGIALCNATLGNILLKEEQYSLARDHYHQANLDFIELGDRLASAITLMNIGITYKNEHNPEQAKINFKKAQLIFRELKSPKNEAQCIANLARLEMEKKNFRGAILKDKEALKLLNKTNSTREKALTLNDIGMSYDSLRNTKQALDYYLQSLSEYEKVNPWSELNEDLHKSIARCYNRLGNNSEAYNHLWQSIRINDSISGKGDKTEMAKIMAKYELDKKEKEIKIRDLKLLSQENEIKKSKLITYSIGLIAFLLLGVVLIAFNRFRLKQKTSNLLQKQADELKITLEKLKSSEKSLLELNSTKDAFFSIIAHDLRGPFNAFINLSEILSENINTFKPEKTIELLRDMHQSANNIYALLENLLDWARVQNNTIPFAPKHLPLVNSINQELDILQNEAKSKEITVHTQFNERCYVFADQNMLRTILRNLLWNAIKFTPRGGEIWADAYDAEESCVVSVKDSGVGMTKKIMERLFKIEHRQSSLGTENELGTGLGLIICKLFTDKNNGTIVVQSEPGKGSTFILSLPKN